MDAVLVTLVVVIVVALIFDYINGFHDTANAIATVVSTGVLPLRTAVLMAAVMNFGGAFMGLKVADTIAKMVDVTAVSQVMVAAGLIGAIAWNLFTWWFGIPSSSSHALLGGILGAAVTKAGTACIKEENLMKAMKGLFLSPLFGFVFGFFLMVLLTWTVRRMRPVVVNKAFRWLQMASAGFMAVSHGQADAQKTMGIITMALVAYGATSGWLHVGSHPGPDGKTVLDPPTWVIVSCAVAMALGTAAGGVRIIKTMGTKIIELKPIHGFAAETGAALTIITAAQLGAPVSTTHVISSSIMGVGSSQRVSAVRWGMTTKILWAWVLTIPISALVGSGCYLALKALLGD
jgi:PiT family inorganic phosphate transporter